MDRIDRDRAHRDQAGVGPYAGSAVDLVPLKKLDGFKVADGEPDIRGWEVRTIGGTKIGDVQDLLVDRAQGEVVMLDIDLDGTDRHSLAPIRAAQIDRARRLVVIDSADMRGPADVPALSRNAVTDEDTRAFGERYARVYGDRGFDREYRVRRDRDEVHFARRSAADATVAAAETRAAADARRAADDAERDARRVADDTAQASAAAAPRDVRYPRVEEERVIERRPVVYEEVVVRRRVVDPSEAAASTADAARRALDDRDRDVRR
jgi:hypothetical protein